MHRVSLVSLAALVSLVLVAACGAAQKPVSIAGAAPPDARARVSTALTTEGQIPDPKTSTDTMVAT